MDREIKLHNENGHKIFLIFASIVFFILVRGGGGGGVGHLLSQQFSTHTLCMVFLARLFLGLWLLLVADTVATQSLGEILPIK